MHQRPEGIEARIEGAWERLSQRGLRVFTSIPVTSRATAVDFTSDWHVFDPASGYIVDCDTLRTDTRACPSSALLFSGTANEVPHCLACFGRSRREQAREATSTPREL